MITNNTLRLSLKSIREFARKRLTDETLIDLDARDECPLEIVRHMCSPDKLGIQLLFIPEEFGGMGGGTFDVYCICEEMARVDLGIATAVLATFLGSDPISVGATPEQKKLWLGRIADEGILFAYGATEPEAGSDLESAHGGPSAKTDVSWLKSPATTVDQQRRRRRRLLDSG
jgi:alkylation response protein AidB-like acyl-CoA dehydrogenase